MKVKSNISLILITILLSGFSFSSTEIQSINKDEIKSLALEKMLQYNIPGIQICVKDGKSNKTINLSLGYSDLENKTPMKNSTQIKVGSMTKSFTALGVLLLVKESKVNLHDEIGKYLDIKEERYGRIKIYELMNMHSGLRGYLNDDDSDFIIDSIEAKPSQRIEPGFLVQFGFKLTDKMGMLPHDKFHYTNTNYILLGLLIEKVSGMSYSDFIRKNIIEPLELNSTFIPGDNKYNDNVSAGYYFDKDENKSANYSNLDLSYVWSAGAVISTASDICNWITDIAEQKVISGNVFSNVLNGFETEKGIQYTSGLINERDKLWHNGAVLGYHGEMCYLKNKNIAVTVLTNCLMTGIKGDPAKEILNGIIDLL